MYVCLCHVVKSASEFKNKLYIYIPGWYIGSDDS